MPGRGEHGLDRLRVELPGSHVGPQLRSRLLRAQRRPVRARLAHRLIRVHCPEDARRPGDRTAREALRVARSVQPLAVLDGDRGRAARAPSDCCSIRSVRYGCSRTRSHSPAPSGPGLSQIAFETPSRPRSWTRPARRSKLVSSSARPSCTAVAAASSDTARACPSVYGDLRSTKSAIASSAWSNCSAGEGHAQVPARRRSPCSRFGPSRARRGPRPGRRGGPPSAQGRTASRHGVRPAQRLLRLRRAGARPRRTPRTGPAAPRSGCGRRRDRRASLCRPTARTRRRPPPAPPPAGRAAPPAPAQPPSAGRPSRRDRGGRRPRTRARPGRDATAGCRSRPATSSWPSRRTLRKSPSYLADLSAMSSPNHFACSCASE